MGAGLPGAGRLDRTVARLRFTPNSFGGEVRVAGMTVRSDDLIHADQPRRDRDPASIIAAKLPEAAELCGRRETPILEIARSTEFSLEKLKAALKRSAEIH